MDELQERITTLQKEMTESINKANLPGYLIEQVINSLMLQIKTFELEQMKQSQMKKEEGVDKNAES